MNIQLNNVKNRVVKSTSLALLIGIALAGCATMPKNSQIMIEATAAVQAAESDPAVPQYASVELSRAHGLLDDHKAPGKNTRIRVIACIDLQRLLDGGNHVQPILMEQVHGCLRGWSEDALG